MVNESRIRMNASPLVENKLNELKNELMNNTISYKSPVRGDSPS